MPAVNSSAISERCYNCRPTVGSIAPNFLMHGVYLPSVGALIAHPARGGPWKYWPVKNSVLLSLAVGAVGAHWGRKCFKQFSQEVQANSSWPETAPTSPNSPTTLARRF